MNMPSCLIDSQHTGLLVVLRSKTSLWFAHVQLLFLINYLSYTAAKFTVILWFQWSGTTMVSNVINSWTQAVRQGSQWSPTTAVLYGIPQGSALWLILFIMYTPDLVRFIERHGLCHHKFADDMQVYGRCSPSERGDLADRVTAKTDDILSWMQSRWRRTHLVFNVEAPATSSDHLDLGWRDYHTFIFCPRSQRLHRCWSVDGLTFNGSRAALPLFVRCVAFVGHCRLLCYSHLCRLFWVD